MRIEFFGIDKLNFVEFNVTGDDLNCQRLSEASRYINSEVFNLFAHCFEKSNELYEYFEPTKYNSRKIVILINELTLNLENLNKINNQGTFVNYVDGIFLGKAFLIELERMDAEWSMHWELYLSLLKEVNREMIAIIQKCIDEGKILWVLGY